MNLLTVVISSLLVLILAIALGFRAMNTFIDPPQVKDEWWGPAHLEPPSLQNISDIHIEEMGPIAFPDDKLADLSQRLANARYFKPLENVNWEYGCNVKDLKDLVRYWSSEFDWREQEKTLNKFKHFKATIDGITIHYVHAKPKMTTRKVVPIMLIHGWPGSFYEFYKVIPLLTKSTDDFSFEVIVPSLPGYTFSEAAHKPGLHVLPIANMFRKLMARLDHDAYYVQGGDWGAAIARTMALIDSSHVKGIHLNMFVTAPPYGPFSLLFACLFPGWSLGSEQHKLFPFKKLLAKFIWETGHFHMQATKPESIAVAMNDSPIGLANYVLEKFFTWSGCDSHENFTCLESKFSKDELLTNVMLYWLTESAHSSMRLYKENKFDRSLASPLHVPTGLANFPHELFQTPLAWLYVAHPNIVQFTEMPRGGHFAALEEPQLFADDVWKFVRKVENTPKTK